MRHSTATIAVIVLCTGLIVGAASGVDLNGLLCLVPAMALAGALLARRYPGERLLVRLAGRGRRTRRRRPPLVPTPIRIAALTPRGGLLLGRSLAVRPPPATAVAS